MKNLPSPSPATASELSTRDTRATIVKTVLPRLLVLIEIIIGICICIEVFNRVTESPNGTYGFIVDQADAESYSVEFADLVGAGCLVPKCTYGQIHLTENPQLGYGPLSDFSGYHFVIGKTGAVGVVTYRHENVAENEKVTLHPDPMASGQTPEIWVIDGFTAPQEWWNHPATGITLHDMLLAPDVSLAEASTMVIWPDDWKAILTSGEKSEVLSCWYWDGEAYTEAQVAGELVIHGNLPSTGSSYLATKGAPRAPFPVSKVLHI